jgi:hypothetical protein
MDIWTQPRVRGPRSLTKEEAEIVEAALTALANCVPWLTGETRSPLDRMDREELAERIGSLEETLDRISRNYCPYGQDDGCS